MEKSKYELVLRFPMACADDIDARIKAGETLNVVLKDYTDDPKVVKIRLQKIHPDQPPQGIEHGWGK